MAENTASAATAAEAGDQNPSIEGSEEKTFTQEELDRIVKERVARVKAKAPDDYAELKAKAKELDDLKEAAKTETEKANERAEKAEAELAEMRRKAKRAEDVREVAEKYPNVGAEWLDRMRGDTREEIEANAEWIAAKLAGQPIYPNVTDNGAKGAPPITREQIEAIKDPKERVRMRAKHLDLYQ